MKSVTCYLTVRVEIDYDESVYKDENEAVQDASTYCDYEFKLNRADLKITETEICGVNE